MTSAKRGEARAFFDAALLATHDQCILWPFADFGRGYGQIQLDGRSRRVHVEACRRVHGPKPAGIWHAAHSCGERRCINPRHLRWATPAENEQDKRDHGSYNHVGADNPRAKLTADEVAGIRSRWQRGSRWSPTSNTAVLADEFGVSECTIRDIGRGSTWWLPDQR